MHFDAAFSLTKRGPGEKRQAHLDGGGVHAEQLGLEAKLVFGRMWLAQSEHFAKQVLKKAYRPGIVGVGKGRASHIFQAPMIQTASGCGQAAQSIAHGAPCGKLNEGHDGELLLETEFARRTASFMPVFKFLKNMSGNQG